MKLVIPTVKEGQCTMHCYDSLSASSSEVDIKIHVEIPLKNSKPATKKSGNISYDNYFSIRGQQIKAKKVHGVYIIKKASERKMSILLIR